MLTTLSPPTDNAALQQQCLDGTTPICHPLAMFRREAALKVGGYDESYVVAQDLDLWLRLGEVGQLACLPDVICNTACMRRALASASRRCRWRT